MTTKNEIWEWLKRGQEAGATHMLVVCDTYDYEDYPVYVNPKENVKDKYKEFQGVNMQRVMEVYDLSKDINLQLTEHRAFHMED